MPICKNIKKPLQNVCTGDMRDKIALYTRSITPPSDNAVDFSETFDNVKNIWSMIVTKAGVEIFDGTNLKGIATHYIYIRWFEGLTEESWILYKNKYYDIIDIQNLDERDEFYLMRCNERGTSTEPVNYA